MKYPFEVRAGSVFGSIEEIVPIGRAAEAGDLFAGEYAMVRGWLLDSATLTPPQSIALGLREADMHRALPGFDRPHVRDTFGEQSLRAGFAGVIPLTASTGNHALEIEVRSDRGQSRITAHELITIVEPIDPFAGLPRADGGWHFAIDGVYQESEAVEIDAVGTCVIKSGGAVIRGWAARADSLQPATEILARSGGRFLRVCQHVLREDVAKNLKSDDARLAGFSVPIMPSAVGTEAIQIFAVDGDDTYTLLCTLKARQRLQLSSTHLPRNASIEGVIDDFSLDDAPFDTKKMTLQEGAQIALRGWAVDRAGPRLIGGLELLVDDVRVMEAPTDIPRDDVVRNLASTGVRDSGFALRWVVPNMSIGEHRIELRALSARRDSSASLMTESVSFANKA